MPFEVAISPPGERIRQLVLPARAQPTRTEPQEKREAPLPDRTRSARHGLSAATLAARLRGQAPGELFLVVPVEVNGRTSHRVLGGLATTSSEADRLMADLSAATGHDRASMVVREAPMSFLMQEAASLDAASAEVDRLTAGGLPAYVLLGTDGVARVYVGAFFDDGEARLVGAALNAAGEAGTIAERRGVPPG